MAFLGYNFQVYWEKGVLPEKCGSGHESICPYQAFEASDRPVLIGIANDNLWRRFCKTVGREELIDDPRFRTNPDRARHRAETVGLVQEIVRTRTCDDWVALLTGLGVPCAPINSLADVLAHPHTAARGIVLDYTHPALGADEDDRATDPVRRTTPRDQGAAAHARRTQPGPCCRNSAMPMRRSRGWPAPASSWTAHDDRYRSCPVQPARAPSRG